MFVFSSLTLRWLVVKINESARHALPHVPLEEVPEAITSPRPNAQEFSIYMSRSPSRIQPNAPRSICR